MDGLYEFNVKSPMGNMRALINIVTNGNTFSGYVDVMGKRTEFNNGTGIGKMQVFGHGLCGTGKRQIGSFGQFARGGHLVLGDFKADNKELFRAIFSPFRTGGSRIKMIRRIPLQPAAGAQGAKTGISGLSRRKTNNKVSEF